jgi:HK97 family phage portal protein
VASKSLVAAISDGLRRPVGVKASLQSWLGVPISLQDGNFWRALSGTSSWTGRQVTVDQALQLATVWACVRLISETIATLPLPLYQRNANGSRTPATNHQLYELLHDQPNADMTAAVFWEIVVSSLLLWGNAYVRIIRNGIDGISGLDFLHPARMTLRRLASGELEYRYRDSSGGKERTIPERNMMHIPAFSLDGKLGLSPVTYGANVMGTAIETDKASAETFQGGLRSPGVITMEEVMTKDQRDRMRAHVKQVSDEGGVMILEKTSKFEPMTFSPHDAELLSSRAWNVEEMCRWFRIDPAMIGHGSKDSNWGTGLEQKMIWFLTFTLRHWCVRIEQSIRKNLLTPVERGQYFAAFNMEGLLRADSSSRAAFYATMTSNGLMTRDECRGKENLPPKGGNADVLTVQSAMVAIDDMSTGTNSAERDILAAAKSWLGIDQPASVED